jgi:WXG100 protein secretion system (Wss), protein YukD
MSVLLVTVVGPGGAVDLAVPAGPPVRDLVDPLARVLGGVVDGTDTSGPRSLAPIGGDPLPPDQSLLASGVADGDVLVLRAGPPAGPTGRPSGRRRAVVGVLSAAAGMGRTTLAALLSRALAAGPGGLTVAVDAHPGPGSLTERLAPEHQVAADDLLALLDHPALSREEVLACLAWTGPGPAVLTSPRGRGRGPLTQRDWTRLARSLAGYGATVVLDCGPGLGDPGASAAVATADQIVLVVETHPSPASRWMSRALANRELPVIAVPWPAAPPPGSPSHVPDPPRPDPLADLPPDRWERACELADLLAADWVGLGIEAP